MPNMFSVFLGQWPFSNQSTTFDLHQTRTQNKLASAQVERVLYMMLVTGDDV